METLAGAAESKAVKVVLCGVKPKCPMNGMPASTIARNFPINRRPPSHLTASEDASLMNRRAFITASRSDASYAPCGMSPMMKVLGAPRRAAFASTIISSIVTAFVVG